MKRKINLKKPKVASSSSSLSVLAVYQKQLKKIRQGNEIFPLDSPGIQPFPANSDFMSFVEALGDKDSGIEEVVIKEDGKSKKIRKLKTSEFLHGKVRSALRDDDFTLPVSVGPHRHKTAKFIPGHLWGSEEVNGPVPADVMIIGKMPWKEEEEAKRCFSGDEGVLLHDILSKHKNVDLPNYYMTYLVKFRPPNWKTILKASWVNDCMPLLQQEIKIVQPKYILCLGTDASKALLGPKASVTAMDGKVETYRYNVGISKNHEGEEFWKEAQVMTVLSPKQVLRDQSSYRQLEKGLGRFYRLTKGLKVGGTENVNHTVIDSQEALLEKLVEIENSITREENVIALDAEWHGEHPVNSGSYVRTIQLSWKPFHAIGVKLFEAGGDITDGFATHDAFDKTGKDLITPEFSKLVTAFLNGGIYNGQKFIKKRVVGHFFNADLEWFVDFLNIDIRESFMCPLFDLEMATVKAKSKRLYRTYKEAGLRDTDYIPAWFRTKYEGGADTGLMAHAIEETASYKLETLAMRYTSAPKYDAALDAWKTSYCKSNGLSSSDMEGYGECPDDVLLPYGMYDADVTLRLFYVFDELLDEDYEGNNCREAFWESQIATPAVLEIHRTGITLDRKRFDFLASAFCKARNSLEVKLKEEINWPDFNIRSTQHVKEFLFGYKLNGKVDKVTGDCVRIRPEGALSLQLMPICDTGKPPKPWNEVISLGKEAESSPSTNKQVLALLAQSVEEPDKVKFISMLRDYRFLDQALKTVLRPPVLDDDTSESVTDDEGNLVYSDGLASMCCDDGKVRTHIYQTKETGRWSSARPNLQNISKQRDPDYKRLLGDDYKHSIRSVLKASKGHVLVEADYVGAELFGMAVMSGDKTMIEHAKRNQLPESDPDFYDIHSNVACFAFRLNCPPTKSGLESIGKKHIRIVAKSVIFGIAYGRGANAIATAAKEQGTKITSQEAQAVIDAIFRMYPKLKPFFEECQKRATGEYRDPETGKRLKGNFLCNCYGRYRRFPKINVASRDSGDSSTKVNLLDNSTLAEFGRQAMNFPIQSMIASAVSRAMAYLYDYKRRQLLKGKDLFKIVLQIHDAILFEVPYEHVDHVCNYVIPKYMRKSVPIWPTDLGGTPTGDGPYYLGIEADVMKYWGESLTLEQATKLGLPTGKGEKEGCVFNFSKT